MSDGVEVAGHASPSRQVGSSTAVVPFGFAKPPFAQLYPLSPQHTNLPVSFRLTMKKVEPHTRVSTAKSYQGLGVGPSD